MAFFATRADNCLVHYFYECITNEDWDIFIKRLTSIRELEGDAVTLIVVWDCPIPTSEMLNKIVKFMTKNPDVIDKTRECVFATNNAEKVQWSVDFVTFMTRGKVHIFDSEVFANVDIACEYLKDKYDIDIEKARAEMYDVHRW